MEAFVGRLEFDQTRASENLKYTPTIGAIVSDLELLSELVERENVSNAPGIKEDWCMTKISFVSGVKGALVAVDANGMGSRANISDVSGVGEEVDRRLTIQEDEIRADGTTSRRVSLLSQDDTVGRWVERLSDLRENEDTLLVAGDGSIIGFVGHGMDLFRRLFAGTGSRDVAVLATILAYNQSDFSPARPRSGRRRTLGW